VSTVVPNLYFQGVAKACSARLVEAGKLQSGEVFRYRVCAYTSRHDASEGLLASTPEWEPLILEEKPLRGLPQRRDPLWVSLGSRAARVSATACVQRDDGVDATGRRRGNGRHFDRPFASGSSGA